MKKLVFIFIAAMAAASCKKDGLPPQPAALRIYNAVPGTSGLIADFGMAPGRAYHLNAQRFNYGQEANDPLLGMAPGEHAFRIYAWPDTVKSIAQAKVSLAAGQIVSLFVSGSLQQADVLQIPESLPYHNRKDSTFALRFLHLSAGAPDVKVEVNGQSMPNTLAYRGYSGFVKYSAKAAAGDMTVRFLEKATGEVLAQYTVAGVGSNTETNAWRNRNFTLSLIGDPRQAGAGGLKTMLTGHY